MSEVKVIKVRCAVEPDTGTAGTDYQEYEVRVDAPMTVLNILEHIYRTLGSDVCFYSFCRRGLCGGCAVEVNGKRVLACKTPVSEDITLRPLVEGRRPCLGE